jgi:RHS repeat-associated protein
MRRRFDTPARRSRVARLRAMRRRFDTPHGEVPRPGQGTVFEHVFDATLGNDTSDPYDRWFWLENPQLGLHQWMYPKRARSPVYDLDGNLVFDDYLFFEYDAENRPIRVVRWGVDQYEFAYDYMGRRVETKYSTGVFEHAQEQWTRRYVYDGWQIIAEVDATPGAAGLPVTSTYFWGYDISHSFGGAGGIGALLLIDHDGERYLPGYDAKGNVVVLVSESTGEMAAGLEYDPYGRILRMQGDVGKIPFRWQTKWDLDCGTEATSQFSWGLYDYGLRFYQPRHGRFINRDPIGEAGGLNLYEAFAGDPVNNWDFLGQYAVLNDLGNNTYTVNFPIDFSRSGFSQDEVAHYMSVVEDRLSAILFT